MRPLVYRNEDFIEAYEKYSDLKEAREKFGLKKYQVSETLTSYRMINHWCEIGLFDDDVQKSEGGWRKFSMIDVVWLSVISELRKFGLGLDAIKKLKDNLFKKHLKHGPSIFEFYISQAILAKKKVFVVSLSDGTGDVVMANQLLNIDYADLHSPLSDSFIAIDLNKIIEKTFNKPGLAKANISTLDLTPKEIEVISKIRLDDISEITTSIKDSKINRITTKNIIQNPENAFELTKKRLKTKGRGEITIKYENGKIVSMNDTEKT